MYAYLFADSHDFPAPRHRSLLLVLQHSEDLNQLLDYAHRALSIHPGLSSAVDHLVRRLALLSTRWNLTTSP